MAKFKLNPEPTFQSKVPFPVAGGEPVDVVLTFKHRTKKQLDEFVTSRTDKSDVESFREMVVGWDLDEEFNAENVDLLLQNFIGVALATYRTYIDQLVQHRRGN